MEQAINKQRLQKIKLDDPWGFLGLPAVYAPAGGLWQSGPWEWVHLPVPPGKTDASYITLLTHVISKGRKCSKEMMGMNVSNIIVPYNNNGQLTEVSLPSEDWQIMQINFTGQSLRHLPSHPLLQF